MPAWTENEVDRLRRRFVGRNEDFGTLVAYVQSVWTAADLEKLERSGRLITWDDYFKREKVIVNMLNDRFR